MDIAEIFVFGDINHSKPVVVEYMKLIIMRHGEAEALRRDDESRCLTLLGKEQAKQAGIWLAQNLGEQVPIDLALVSTYTRAQQTYVEVQKQLKVSNQQQSTDVLPSSNAQVAHDYMLDIVMQEQQISSLLIVSHMPFVSYFLEEVHAQRRSTLFDTSSIVILDYDPVARAGEMDKIYHPS
jgi:phosphohistidine phosphatase